MHADEHQSSSKFLQVGIIAFDGSGQICQKYPKQKVGNIFAKSVASFLCSIFDAKHSDISRGSSHVYCYLFPRTVRLEIFCMNISILEIKQQLYGEGLPSFSCLCSKLMFFNRNSKSFMAIKQAKKSLYQAMLYKYFHPKSYKKVPPYCN